MQFSKITGATAFLLISMISASPIKPSGSLGPMHPVSTSFPSNEATTKFSIYPSGKVGPHHLPSGYPTASTSAHLPSGTARGHFHPLSARAEKSSVVKSSKPKASGTDVGYGHHHANESGHAHPTSFPVSGHAKPSGAPAHKESARAIHESESASGKGFAKPTGHFVKPTAVKPSESGVAKPTGHFKPTGVKSGVAKPTGFPEHKENARAEKESKTVESGVARPTGHFSKPAGVKGSETLKSGVAKPTGHGHYKPSKVVSGVAKPTGLEVVPF